MRKLSEWFFPLLLLGICVFVAYRNYVPGTWLIGWDSLLPELNLKLNIARSLSAVWQEYQGLGLLGGMAHAADLPRQVILAGFSAFIPTSFLRYFWAFLMLLIGPMGTYMLVSKVFISKDAGLVAKMAGFASAVFYLFNLATLQTFYTPFETFVGFYGFFPWLLYFAARYLSREKGRPLVMFAIVSILGAGAFYVQTLFVVYALFLTVFALESIVRFGKDGLLRSVKLALVTLFVNAFWLLPVLFFSLTSSSIPATSHINSIATPETQLMNLARTDFKDIATLKGYWFDYYDWGKDGTYDYLYKNWINYTNQPNVANISLILFFVSSAGLAVSLLKKKTSYALSLLALLGISYFMLNGGQVTWIPYFSEIFRNAFTKWANAMALIYAVGIGLFVYVVSDVIKSKLKYFCAGLISLCIVGASIFSVLPVIKGELIGKSMKLGMPSYYLETINYFKAQDSTKRIADFPLTDFWGWKFNDWGYRGSGFLWYGIPQPMLDRAFDVWSPYNEAFYSEISHVIETGNSNELKYVLNKYQVSYILFDQSIFEPGDPGSPAKIQKQKDFLESSGLVTKAKEFGKITVFKVDLTDTVNSFVSAPSADHGEPFIKLGQTGAMVVQEMFAGSQGYQTAKNCDLMGQGRVIKTKADGGDYYAAFDGGVSCDYFYYPALDYSKAYSMRIVGKNISGRSLKIYLYNVANKSMDMEGLLPTGYFDKSYVIYPTTTTASVGEGPASISYAESVAGGYTLNVETRSFGKVKSENEIKAIEFYDIQDTVLNGAYSIKQNDLKILSVQKYGTWAYKVDVQGSGLIQLGQGYETGWKAFPTLNYHLSIFNFQLNLQSPNLKRELKHTKFNSWSNTWEVNSANCSNENSLKIDNCGLLIVYWPQLLEWVGAVLGLVGVGICRYKAKIPTDL